MLPYASIQIRDVTSITWQIEHCPICLAFLGISLLEPVFHENTHFSLLQANYTLTLATQVSCFSEPATRQEYCQKNHLDFILPHFTTKILRSSLYYCSSIYMITRTNSAEHFIISTCAAVTVLHLIQWLVELHFNILLKVMFRYFHIHSDAFPFRTAVLHNSSNI